MKQQETIYRLMDNTPIGKFPGPMDESMTNEHITEREEYRIYDRKKRKDNNSNQNFIFSQINSQKIKCLFVKCTFYKIVHLSPNKLSSVGVIPSIGSHKEYMSCFR
mgnify:CR=1 FL=1